MRRSPKGYTYIYIYSLYAPWRPSAALREVTVRKRHKAGICVFATLCDAGTNPTSKVLFRVFIRAARNQLERNCTELPNVTTMTMHKAAHAATHEFHRGHVGDTMEIYVKELLGELRTNGGSSAILSTKSNCIVSQTTGT